MAEQSPRVLLQRADRERRTAEAVEDLLRAFRLGEPVGVKRGLFGRIKGNEFRALTEAESLALYRAAQIVRRESLAEAEALESQVTTQKGA